MSLLYMRRKRLSEGHTNSVIALSFNPSGNYLASAGLDGRLCIWLWSSSASRPRHVVKGTAGFISLAWINDAALVAGRTDGVMITFSISTETICATGFNVHYYPLECITVAGNLVATGAHSQLSVWELSTGLYPFDRCDLIRQLNAPPTNGTNRHKPIVVTSIHWARGFKDCESALLVAYMDHGVMVIDTRSGLPLQTLSTMPSVGFASLSQDKRWVVTSNLSTGFDIYNMGSMSCYRSITAEDTAKTNTLRPPALFAHHGRVLVGATSAGKVGLWDWNAEKPLHDLPHHGKPSIISLADHYERSSDTFFLATGTHGLGKATYVQVWQTQTINNARSATRSRGQRRRSSKSSKAFSLLCPMIIGAILSVVGWMMVPSFYSKFL
ncbi:WD40 repeat-like protein [Pluteus cervinus]|uniref:WD40 repeat-like protein n=1 Tax=Pluteus cervinus TaxID=181527 RepID=A0ACD3A5H1_9AGAR|nr:WD40 repeat-like protein [Pluteus cervinus]